MVCPDTSALCNAAVQKVLPRSSEGTDLALMGSTPRLAGILIRITANMNIWTKAHGILNDLLGSKIKSMAGLKLTCHISSESARLRHQEASARQGRQPGPGQPSAC